MYLIWSLLISIFYYLHSHNNLKIGNFNFLIYLFHEVLNVDEEALLYSFVKLRLTCRHDPLNASLPFCVFLSCLFLVLLLHVTELQLCKQCGHRAEVIITIILLHLGSLSALCSSCSALSDPSWITAPTAPLPFKNKFIPSLILNMVPKVEHSHEKLDKN